MKMPFNMVSSDPDSWLCLLATAAFVTVIGGPRLAPECQANSSFYPCGGFKLRILTGKPHINSQLHLARNSAVGRYPHLTLA